MKVRPVIVLLFVLALNAFAQTVGEHSAPKADDRFKADVLLVVAHPDDETGVSAYLAQLLDQGKHVAAVYLTHGEAGHNNMGRERGISLGAVREMELRHSLTQLGIQNVWFLAGRDTPSQDVLRSLANWGQGACLEQLLRIVRLTRPYVIMTWLPAFFIGENHGDHQASGVLATEAFDLAGDPSIFPAQLAQPRNINETLLEGLEPWQPQKLYFFSDASDDKQFKGKGPEYPTTAISPTRHLPYWRIAMDGFRFHRTQYRSYIEKLDAMNPEQLAKLASADQDGWATPVSLIFGKAVVPSSTIGDVFEGIVASSVPYVSPRHAALAEPSGVTVALGGPWHFYQDFRRSHDLVSLPQAQVPEIAIAAATTLQVPIIFRNSSPQAVDISLTPTLPDGWQQKDLPQSYHLAPGDTYPIQLDLTTPAKKSDQINQLKFAASTATGPIGSIDLRVRVGTGGLPQ
jgi:LmbE family N-acetylglucosaminyl deacetylase